MSSRVRIFYYDGELGTAFQGSQAIKRLTKQWAAIHRHLPSALWPSIPSGPTHERAIFMFNRLPEVVRRASLLVVVRDSRNCPWKKSQANPAAHGYRLPSSFKALSRKSAPVRVPRPPREPKKAPFPNIGVWQ
jgi:hypothetical protein